jgi:TolB-like protein/class 3 adenylate cyclase/Flp pilus assembly protein TadD
MSDEPGEQRRLAAIMFTDMVGYSALSQRDEALAIELLEEHRRLVRGIICKYQGAEIKTTGDGFLLEFGSALSAVNCAVDIQSAMAQRNRAQPPLRQVSIRIGIHVGDIIKRADDVIGDGVNIAARIEPLAEPGGIAVSQQVYDHVQNKTAMPLVRVGAVDLKNINRPVEIYRVEIHGKRDGAATSDVAAKKSPPEKSIAVLPFVNMSSDPSNEYLSDGITEDLITALSRVPGLRVSARTSSFAFKNKNEDIRRIGEHLNVALILEGSVRKAENRLRITAQLINVADGCHLRADRYDREMQDIFAVQDEISQTIVEALKLQVNPQEKPSITDHQTASAAAYELYLKGRYYWNLREAAVRKGLHYFELALLEDPNYALAYTGVADSYIQLSFYTFITPREANPKALAAINRALELKPDSSEAHESLACYQFYCSMHNKLAAEREFLTALELNPKNISARSWYLHLLIHSCRPDEAREQIEIIAQQELNPAMKKVRLATLYMTLGRLDDAIAQFPPNDPAFVGWMYPHLVRGWARAIQGRGEEAVPELERVIEIERTSFTLGLYGYGLARAGRREEAQKIIAELSDPSRYGFVRAFSLAQIHLGFGDYEQSLSWLEKAYQDEDVWITILKSGSMFSPLRDDERFKSILRRSGMID